MKPKITLLAIAAIIAILGGGQDAYTQDTRLSRNCKLYPHSLLCLGYDLETAKKLLADEEIERQKAAAEFRRSDAERTQAETIARQAPAGKNEYGPESAVISNWEIICTRDKITDKSQCFMATNLYHESMHRSLGRLLVLVGRGKDDTTLLLSPDIKPISNQLYRIDTNEALQFDQCSESYCTIVLRQEQTAWKQIHQGEILLTKPSGLFLSAKISRFAEAYAEFIRLRKRWGVED
ncbi:hypothetical protein [Ferrovibrio sp.]|uniref:hypothetical protein n=1 Tax=Ferrovibrio sp. TaxID=1917215 RepID=UPI0025C439D4|nr:hypothetical protein [Ferrovibrio sp.]MBX3455130.1 hypothetical protein [Ferrovibrio sp.]